MSFQDSEAKWKGERKTERSRANEAASAQRSMTGHEYSFDLTQRNNLHFKIELL
jgi:hypothetical protein